VKQEITKIDTTKAEKVSFQIVFRDTLNTDIAECISWIEREILQPSITTKMYNNLTGETTPYALKFSYTTSG
jgi:hypothetical protein